MKKVKIIFVFILIFSLCSCKGLTSMSEIEDAVLVCALGFDRKGEIINMSAEISFVIEETTVISVLGENPEECFKKIEENLPEKLIFFHCGTVVLGQSLTHKTANSIIYYLFKKDDFPLNAYVVSSDNASDILNCKIPSKTPVGYSISKLLREKDEENDSRIFSLYKNKEKLLPCFKADEKTIIKEAQKWKIN